MRLEKTAIENLTVMAARQVSARRFRAQIIEILRQAELAGSPRKRWANSFFNLRKLASTFFFRRWGASSWVLFERLILICRLRCVVPMGELFDWLFLSKHVI